MSWVENGEWGSIYKPSPEFWYRGKQESGVVISEDMEPTTDFSKEMNKIKGVCREHIQQRQEKEMKKKKITVKALRKYERMGSKTDLYDYV